MKKKQLKERHRLEVAALRADIAALIEGSVEDSLRVRTRYSIGKMLDNAIWTGATETYVQAGIKTKVNPSLDGLQEGATFMGIQDCLKNAAPTDTERKDFTDNLDKSNEDLRTRIMKVWPFCS